MFDCMAANCSSYRGLRSRSGSAPCCRNAGPDSRLSWLTKKQTFHVGEYPEYEHKRFSVVLPKEVVVYLSFSNHQPVGEDQLDVLLELGAQNHDFEEAAFQALVESPLRSGICLHFVPRIHDCIPKVLL